MLEWHGIAVRTLIGLARRDDGRYESRGVVPYPVWKRPGSGSSVCLRTFSFRTATKQLGPQTTPFGESFSMATLRSARSKMLPCRSRAVTDTGYGPSP